MLTRLQKGVATAALLSLAAINYFSNCTEYLTDTPLPDLDGIPDPSHPGLSRRLAHNPSDSFRKRQQKIANRREQWRIAHVAKEEKRDERLLARRHVHASENQEVNDERVTKEDNIMFPEKICSRPTDVGSAADFALLGKYSTKVCPGTTGSDTSSILLLEGMTSHGRTGNNLIEFLHALQYARDQDVHLGIMRSSWAMQVLLKMWMSITEGKVDEWTKRFEEAFCVKIFKTEEELKGWNVIHKTTKELFFYTSEKPLHEYIASQEDSLRTLWRSYNTGEGVDGRNHVVNDMCTGIDAMFGDNKQDAIYSVIHSRSMEGAPGLRILANVAKGSGCDPVAALEMRPDYVKSILAPLGMLNYPIVLITDGQDSDVVRRLVADPDIGPKLRLVPQEASWVGGDLTLAIMSNVFIGNPASTFSGFIARSRLSIGFSHNYLFRAKNEEGEWFTVCDDECSFDRRVMGGMS